MKMEVVTPKKSLARPHNCYNIYFILEREKLIKAIRKESSDGAAAARSVSDETKPAPFDLAGYDFLSLPDLPPRYQDLSLEHGWYIPGKNANRKHVKSHGLTSFADLARTVAKNWKVADDETKNYCKTVARIIKERHAALGGTMKKGSNGPKSSKKKSKDSAKKGSQTSSKKQQRQQLNGQRRASMPNMVMANTTSGGNLCRSSSTAYSDIIICPDIFSVTPEQAISNFHLDSTNLSVTPEQAVSNFHLDSMNLSVTSEQAISNFRESMNKIRQMDNSRNHGNRRWSSSMVDYLPQLNNTSECHDGNKTIQEVDMSDSAIRDMWRSVGV